MAFSATGDLATANPDGIRIGGRLVSALEAGALVFRPDGAFLAAGLQDGTVRILAPDGKETQRLEYGTEPVTRLAWRSGYLAAVSSASGAVQLWAEKFETPSLAPVHEGGVAAVAIAPDEPVYATAGLDQTVKIWRSGSKTPSLVLRTPPAQEARLTDVTFLDPTHLAVAYQNGSVRLFPMDDASLRASAAAMAATRPCASTNGPGSR